jgi:hypothetical protein
MKRLQKPVFAIVLLAAAPGISALGAIPNQAPQAQEVYSATEMEGTAAPTTQPMSVPAVRSVPVTQVPVARQAQITTPTPVSRPQTQPQQATPRRASPPPQQQQQPVLVRQPLQLPRPIATATVPAPARIPDSGLAYDPVPSDQIDALGRRLELVDALVRRHARAYDYRTHTVRDLELILAKLDASAGDSRSAQQ